MHHQRIHCRAKNHAYDAVEPHLSILKQLGLSCQFFALVVLLACIAFLTLTLGLQLDTARAAWATIALFFVVRMLTIRYNWHTHPLMPD